MEFCCPKCGKYFFDKSARENHMMKAHDGIGYKCVICGGTGYALDLKRKESYRCRECNGSGWLENPVSHRIYRD